MIKNYIDQINGFWNWRRTHDISHLEADLYYTILDVANGTKWKVEFNIPNSTLYGLFPKTTLISARNRLVQLGLITYKPGKKGQAGLYTVIPLGRNSNSNTITDTYSNNTSDTVDNSTNVKQDNMVHKDMSVNNHQDFNEVKMFYENNIGLITITVQNDIINFLDTVSGDVIIWALGESVQRASRNKWLYAKQILNNCIHEGKTTLDIILKSKNQTSDKDDKGGNPFLNNDMIEYAAKRDRRLGI